MAEPQTRQENSAGGCVYKRQENVWLLGKHSGYHKWVLPKGLIEAGEKPEETAVREVREEMGVRARILGEQPVYVDKYSYAADFKTEKGSVGRVAKYQESGGGQTRVDKTVTYFLMEWVAGEPKDHDFEMEEAGWFSLDEALVKLAFEGEREALKLAQRKL